jgi:predicted F0F1-ATPase subunit
VSEADEEGDPVVNEVRKKALRRARARRRQSLWSHLSSVGILGWVFVLPVVAFTLLGKLLADRYDRPAITLVGLAFGLLTGGLSAYRNIRRSLAESTDTGEDE